MGRAAACLTFWRAAPVDVVTEIADHNDALTTAQGCWLLTELRLARRSAGLSLDEVAVSLDWSISKLARIENGSSSISTSDLKALLGCYRIDDPRKVAKLVAVARSLRRPVSFGAISELSPPVQLSPEKQVWKHLTDDDFEHAIEAQLQAANLIFANLSTTEGTAADSHFETNESFWEKVLDEQLRANATVILKDFNLFEWFPRSPGLFHTKRGQLAREDAADRRILSPMRASPFSPDTRVYNLQGKVRMLQGGLGCIRLLPKQTKIGTLWFNTA
jgi:transcriptional regulator with XRE-family HTH domain